VTATEDGTDNENLNKRGTTTVTQLNQAITETAKEVISEPSNKQPDRFQENKSMISPAIKARNDAYNNASRTPDDPKANKALRKKRASLRRIVRQGKPSKDGSEPKQSK
jgi:hypothetical protein